MSCIPQYRHALARLAPIAPYVTNLPSRPLCILSSEVLCLSYIPRSTAQVCLRYVLSLLIPHGLCLRLSECCTRYYHNYYISSSADPQAKRVYYTPVPTALEVSDHFFVLLDFCKWIEAEITFSQ